MKNYVCDTALSLKIGNPLLEFGVFETEDPKLTGRQIVELYGVSPAEEHLVFKFDERGYPTEIALDSTVSIQEEGQSCFIVFASTASYRFSMDGHVYEWGDSEISGKVLDEIFVPEGSGERVWVAHRDKPDQLVGHKFIDLSDDGLERFYLQKPEWFLNVQGVKISSDTVTITVSEALVKAGFDPNAGWIAVLKVKGKPKQSVGIDEEIDLSAPGIEKLRLTPKEIRNGELLTQKRHEFPILEGDKSFLSERQLSWETVIENGRRWFILRGYRLPDGYHQNEVDIAIEVPTGYPAAQLDMFYCFPHLQRSDGRSIPTTEARQQIGPKIYQRWSRHRGSTNPWNPQFDSLVTQIVLAEESIHREVTP